MKKLKTYIPFATNAFQSELTYKGNTIMFFCGEGILISVTFFLWRAIYKSSESAVIEGFTFNQMIVYMLIAFLTNLLVSTDVSSNISREVKDGSIAINLIRPISYSQRMMFQSVGVIFFNFVIVFIPAFIVITLVFYNLEGSISIFNILMYFISSILSMILTFYYSYCFGLLSFKITNMWGLSQIMQAITRLISGALIPLSFFPEVVGKIFNILPFSSMISTPTLIYLGKLNGLELIKGILIQVIWVLIFIAISKWIWNKLIKQLTILGG